MKNTHKILIAAVGFAALFILLLIARYWYADTLYARAKNLNIIEKPKEAVPLLTKAVAISPKEALYHQGLSESYTLLAISTQNQDFIDSAMEEIQTAINLSPANVNLKRAKFTMFIKLALVDPDYLIGAIEALEESLAQAPTDAKLYYNLGLTYYRIGQTDKAAEILQKTIELKSNYKDARIAYAVILDEKGRKQEAISHLEYILTNIEPNDELTKQTLEEIK